MKKVAILSLLLSLLCLNPFISDAQFDLGRKIRKNTEKAIDQTTNRAADKGIDEAEKGVDKLYEGGQEEAGDSRQDEVQVKSAAKEAVSPAPEKTTAEAPQEEDQLAAYSRYNFVPGDIVIFEDNQENEENGEFPSKWDLKSGNVEIARYGSGNVINFPDVNWGRIVPLMTEKGDYLPEKFTLEFDAYFSEFCTKYWVSFYDMVNQKSVSGFPELNISPTGISAGQYGTTKITTDKSEYPFWKHIAVSFNIRSLKVFYGETRTTNIPNLQANPTGITISGSQCHGDHQAMIKNIRIATGQLKLYDRVLTDGRFYTNGIRFDVGKSSIRPESMGVINEVHNMMAEHPELKFSVIGHTDSDGDDASNMKLSEERATAVVNQLITMGIETGRFEARGMGESQPIDTNSTPEGKANNRRVEFIKI